MSRSTKLPPSTSLAACNAAPRPLTPIEARIIAAFRTMDGRRQEGALTRMERIASTHPLHRAPLLRLIAGGAL